MRKIKKLSIIISIIQLFWTGLADAQQEQWLQYKSAREVSISGISTNLIMLDTVEKAPDDVQMPQFVSEEPILAKWNSPLVPTGFLWIAADKSTENGPFDRFYIDSDGDGQLNDETAEEPYRTTQYYTYFGPVKVVFQVDGGPVAYHLNFTLYSNQNNQRIYTTAAGWYEGSVTIDNTEKYVVLFDYNANGAFNDSSTRTGDRINIGEPGDLRSSSVGKYVQVNGTLYETEIPIDGAYIAFSPAKDVVYGNVKLPTDIAQLTVSGENGSFEIKPENGTSSLPIGSYQVVEWVIERQDEQGAKWTLTGTQTGRKGDFEVTADKDTELVIGEPVVAHVTSSQSGQTLVFQQSLTGKDGENITLTRNGTRPQAPKLNIKNEEGTYDRTYSFAYG